MNDTTKTSGRKKISETASEGNDAIKGALAVIDQGKAVAKFDLSQFEVKREVAVPQLSVQGDNVQLAVRIVSLMSGKPNAKGHTVYSVKVQDLLDDSVEKAMVVPAIVQSELDRTYPDGSYLGKFFALSKLGKAAGKNYNNWDIKEIGPKGA